MAWLALGMEWTLARMIECGNAALPYLLGFRWHEATVRLPDAGWEGGDRLVVRWLERSGSPDSAGGTPPLILIPGLTMEAKDLALFLARHFDRRVLVLELPGQGRSRFRPTPPWHWTSPLVLDTVVRGWLAAVGCTPSRPCDIVGYSLGGAVVGRLMCGPAATLLRRRVLLAPGFIECVEPEFKQLLESQPERVHAYDTAAGMKECFCDTAFGVYRSAMPPDFLLGGYVRLRREHGPGYFVALAGFLMGQPDEVLRILPRVEDAAALDGGRTLFVAGERDNCVSGELVAQSAARARSMCLILPDCGHVGGPKTHHSVFGFLRVNLFGEAAPHIAAFLG